MSKPPRREPMEEDMLPPPGPPKGDLPESDEEFFFRHIGILERTQRKVHRTIFSQQGLHPSQGIALVTIIDLPGQSQRELADRLHIERATLTGMVQKLEKGGFIERRPDPADQRILRLYPTEKGLESERQTHALFEAMPLYAFQGIDAVERARIRQQLTLIEENMNRFYAEQLAKKESQE